MSGKEQSKQENEDGPANVRKEEAKVATEAVAQLLHVQLVQAQDAVEKKAVTG